MSVIGVGDVITIIQLVDKIVTKFGAALTQYRGISDTVRSLVIVLRHADVNRSNQGLSDDEKKQLDGLLQGCKSLLSELEQRLSTYSSLGSPSKGFKTTVRRAYDRLSWDQEVIQDFRDRISNHVILLNSFNTSMANKNIANLQQYQVDRQHQDILDWLSPVNAAAQRCDCMKQYQQGTGEWFVRSPEYQKWVEEEGQVLFCPGMPGAGKTILTSLVAERLMKRFSSHGNVAIAYIYFDFQQPELQSREGILASLLKQLVLCRDGFPSKIKLLYQQHRHRGTRMSLDEVSSCLSFVMSHYHRTFILLNKFDDCPNELGLRSWVLRRVSRLRDRFKANIFITSRDIPDIMEKLSLNATLRISATDEDVRHYLRSKIQEIPLLKSLKDEMIKKIIDGISAAVGGMFLLARLHLESLAGEVTPADIEERLKSLPKGDDPYPAAYDSTMSRVKGKAPGYQRLARRVLSCIVGSQRPLSPLELCHALGVQKGTTALKRDSIPEIKTVLSVCAGLVVVDEESNTIRLVHRTAHHYFSHGSGSSFLDNDPVIATACITYLLYDEFHGGVCQTEEEFKRRLLDNPLYEYAASYWGYHANMVSLDLQELIIKLLRHENCVKAASQVLFVSRLRPWNSGYSQRVPSGMSGLHLAAYFGLVQPVSVLLQSDMSVNMNDANNCTPLSWAARNGHEQTVKELLKQDGIRINAEDKNGRGPLSWAAENGHTGVVRVLVEAGAMPDIPDSNGRTPLSLAAMYGREAVVEFLATTDGVVIDSPYHNFRTPLSYAAEKGHLGVVQRLLDKSSDPGIIDTKYERTPLSRAAWNGRTKVVEALLTRGNCKQNQRDVYGWTPLALAAAGGWTNVVRLLLNDNVVDVNAENNHQDAPLDIAIGRRHPHVVRELLESRRVVVDSSTRYGYTLTTVGFLSKQELDIIKHLRAKYEQNGDSLPDNFRLHPPVDLENLITCNLCKFKIPNAEARYHCEICEDGNFYTCQKCNRGWTHCLEQSHRVRKQVVTDGVLVDVPG